MKRILCILILACIVSVSAFAQQKPATTAPATAKAAAGNENSLGIDLFQMTKGFIASDSDAKFFCFIISAGYERLIAPHFSIGGDVDMYFIDFDGTGGFYFGLAGEGRYYPQSTNFEKFFLGATLGFNLLSVDGKTKPDDGGFFGLTTSLKAGYKLLVGKNMYLEPSLAYVLSKQSSGPSFSGGSIFGIALPSFSFPSVPTPCGWNGGLRLGFTF